MSDSDHRLSFFGFAAGNFVGTAVVNAEAVMPLKEGHVQAVVSGDMVYKSSDGNRATAARRLGIALSTLYDKIHRHRLEDS